MTKILLELDGYDVDEIRSFCYFSDIDEDIFEELVKELEGETTSFQDFMSKLDQAVRRSNNEEG
jgi:hypothetical protein